MRGVWAYREPLYFLAWRDVKLRYKQTALGVVWVALQPIALATRFAIVFSRFLSPPSAPRAWDCVDGEHALVRDKPEAFAAGVVALYRDRGLLELLSKSSKHLVRERRRPEVMRGRLNELVETAVRRRSRAKR